MGEELQFSEAATGHFRHCEERSDTAVAITNPGFMACMQFRRPKQAVRNDDQFISASAGGASR